MKKIIIAVASVLAVAIAVTVTVICCNQKDNKGGMISAKTENWQNVYVVGQQISLDGLFVLYYEDGENTDDYQKISATQDMVKGFNSATVGEKQITLTYNGYETLGVTYYVIEDIALELNETFAIGDNLAVNLNTQTGKATIYKYSNFKAFKNFAATATELDVKIKPVKTEDSFTKAITFIFENNLYTYKKVGQNHTFSVTRSYSVENGIGSSTDSVFAVTTSNIVTPTVAVKYQSEVKDGKKAIALFDADYNLNVYIVDESVTSVEGLDPTCTFAVSCSYFTNTGVVRYVIDQNDSAANRAMVGSDKSVTVKVTSNGTNYSFTCTRQD